VLDHLIDKSQSTPLTTQRPIANTREDLILVVAIAVELGDYSPAFALAIPIDGIEYETPDIIEVFKIFGGDVLENIGNGEKGTGS